MKHIGFDESSVLNEYARIAHREGLIKVAAEPKEMPEPNEPKHQRPPSEDQERKNPPRADMGEKKEWDFGMPADDAGADKYKISLVKIMEKHREDLGAFDLSTKGSVDVVVSKIKQLPSNDLRSFSQQAYQLINSIPDKEFKNKILGDFVNVSRSFGLNYKPQMAADGKTSQAQNTGAAKKAQAEAMKRLHALNDWYGIQVQKVTSLPKDKAQLAREKINKQFDKMANDYIRELNQMFPNIDFSGFKGSMMKLKQASAQNGMVINAAGDIYDVTDETGEDLVDMAHPGGGTSTELTHSKTDEGLVETIVEQQEKDIDVAKKAPRGVVAALTELADNLDKLGYARFADRVDGIVKSAFGPAQSMKQDFIAAMKGVSSDDAAKEMLRPNMERELAAITTANPLEAMQKIVELGKKWDYAFDGALAEAMKIKNQYAPVLQSRQKPDVGAAGDVSKTETKPVGRKTNPASDVIEAFQNGYNEAIKGSDLEPISVDGIQGPETRAALKRVRDAGGLKSLTKELMRKVVPLEPIPYPPAPPAPPAPPPSPEAPGAPQQPKPEDFADKYIGQRFRNLQEKYAPEFYEVLRDEARRLYESYANIFTEQAAMEKTEAEMRDIVRSITTEEVKQYIDTPTR